MDNAQKAIMIGVGLFITIIVIAAVMAITGIGTGLLNQGQAQLGGLSANLEQQLTAEYDNVPMSGAQVLAAVQKYYNDPTMIIAVNNVSVAAGSTYAVPIFATATKCTVTPPKIADAVVTGLVVSDNTAGRLTLNAFTSSSSANRIVTTGQYQAKLIQLNGATIGINFLRK